MINQITAEVYIYVRDESGTPGYMKLHVGGNVEIATARGAVNAITALLLSVSDCTVTSYRIVYKTYVEEGLPDGPEDTMSRGLLVFLTPESSEYGVIIIPGINAALIQPDNTLNIADAALQSLIEYFIVGPWCSPFEKDLTALEATLYEIKP